MFKKFIIILISLLVLVLATIFFILGGGFGKKKLTAKSEIDNSLIIFAHRGIANYYAENTKESFDSARSLGFKAVEIDIRQTKDDVFVLFHDDNCKRLTGKNINL